MIPSDHLLKRLMARLTTPDHVTPNNPCLNCGTALDRATITDGDDIKPYEGAISICWHCGHVQAFDDKLRFRELTDAEMIEIAGEPEIIMANTIRGPLKELAEKRDSMSQAEVTDRLNAILAAVIKAEKARE